MVKTTARILLVAMFVTIIPNNKIVPQTKKQKYNLGILDITPNGVSKDVAKSLTGRLSTEIVNTGRFNVVEREKIQSILDEYKLRQSGLINDEKAVAKVGELLGVQAVLVGSVGKIGETFVVDIRLIIVHTGRVGRTAKISHKDINKLVPLMKNIAYEIVGMPNPKGPKRWPWIVLGSTVAGFLVYKYITAKGTLAIEVSIPTQLGQ